MSGTMSFTSVNDIIALQGAMQQIELQAIDIEQYVDTWVCQKAGFEPTDICVLKPFARAMDAIKDAFGQACTEFFDKWGNVREEVGRSIQDIQRQDHDTVTKLDVLMGQEERYVRLANAKVIAT